MTSGFKNLSVKDRGVESPRAGVLLYLSTFLSFLNPSIARIVMNTMISVDKVTKKYGKFTAVDNISFSVNKGELFAFLGPNGAGKTTTIKMLTTLLKPTSGHMSVNGHDTDKDPDAVRRSFGIVFQDPSLDEELTAFENLELHGLLYDVPKELRRERIKELLTFVELWERKDDFVKLFSGGMKRRLEIARCILHHPSVIFLDEPTVGLDPQTRNHIWGYLQQLKEKENITVLFTTHYMEEAEKVAHRVAVIDAGKIVGQGTPDELKEKTKSKSLEDAFLKLTGHTIREEEASGADVMRLHRRVWGGK